jgi:hypothetical protein
MCEVVDWFLLVEDRFQCHTLVNTEVDSLKSWGISHVHIELTSFIRRETLKPYRN